MNLENLQLRAGAAERLLKAMASQPRLMILCELLKGERTVTALAPGRRPQHVRDVAASGAVARGRTRRDPPRVADDLLFAGRRRRDPDARDALFDLLLAHGGARRSARRRRNRLACGRSRRSGGSPRPQRLAESVSTSPGQPNPPRLRQPASWPEGVFLPTAGRRECLRDRIFKLSEDLVRPFSASGLRARSRRGQ